LFVEDYKKKIFKRNNDKKIKAYSINIKNPIYISKSRCYNNEVKIKRIQNFFRKVFTNNINIIKKPMNNVDTKEVKDNQIDKIKHKGSKNKR